METQRYVTPRQYATRAGIEIQAVYERLKKAGIESEDIDGTLMIDTEKLPITPRVIARRAGVKNKKQLTVEEKKERNRLRVQKFRDKNKI